MSKAKKTKGCRHHWRYVHPVYTGRRGGLFVRRYCTSCGKDEVGRLCHWRPSGKGQFPKSVCEFTSRYCLRGEQELTQCSLRCFLKYSIQLSPRTSG